MSAGNAGNGPRILDGREPLKEMRAATAERVRAAGAPVITLATLLVGQDPASQVYLRMKDRSLEAAGLHSRHVALSDSASQVEVEEAVGALAQDPAIHGILVEFPLPEHLDAEAVVERIPPHKDIDGLTERNLGRLVRGRRGLVPCTPLGVMRLIERYEVPTRGARAVVVGRSPVVGLPQMLLLSARGVDATVTVAHSRTPDLAAVTREADILVAAVGRPGLITAEYVKPGAAVLDVGVTETDDGIVGDVDLKSVEAVAGALTPMPGGTGPMTVACMLENLVEAARMQGALPEQPPG